MKKNRPSGATYAGDYSESELSAAVLQTLNAGNGPLRLDDLLHGLGLGRKHGKRVETVLENLRDSGKILRLKGRFYASSERLRQVIGKLSIQRAGAGFILPERMASKEVIRGKNARAPRGNEPDVYVHPENLGGAWPGDRVRAVVFPDRRGKNPEGRIIEVLERAAKEVPVRVLHRPNRTDYGGNENDFNPGASENKAWIARPLDSRFGFVMLVDVSSLAEEVQAGQVLLARPLPPEAGSVSSLLRGAATANLGAEESLALQERLVKASYDIPTAFPAEVEDEAALLPVDPSPEEIAAELGGKRRDSRDIPFITIDGADARDFDDAIHVSASPSGFTLLVAIADVAHYVRPGSGMDREALARGNSYYFPASVEPMLPRRLSNGLCSLNEGRPRLAMVAELDFSPAGEPGAARFYPALIISRGRLTYDEAQAVIDGEAGLPERLAAHQSMLRQAAVLAGLCIERRNQAGNLDFELPEAGVEVDVDGRVIGMAHREHLFSHRLIEAFMVAANEAVARRLRDSGVNHLYRVHPAPDPDKLSSLVKSLLNTTFGAEAAARLKELPAVPTAGHLRGILSAASLTPEAFIVSRLVLRAMMQARYSPEPSGHFGLASECYCHFTSPIRRYADLLTHRALKAQLEGRSGPGYEGVAATGESVNASERKATEAEREIERVCAALFLRGRIGEKFNAVISGVSDYGFFVEVENMAVEGMVRLDSLLDDRYAHDLERNELYGLREGRVFRLGARVRVVLNEVDVERREITFALAENEKGRKGPVPAGRRGRSGPDAGRADGSGERRGRNGKKPRLKKTRGLTTSRRTPRA